MFCQTKLLWLGLALFCLGAGLAEAQEQEDSVQESFGTYDFTVPAQETQPAFKSPQTALWMSMLGTVVPLAMTIPTVFRESSGPDDGQMEALLFLGGLVVGPSLGHFYAGRPGRAFSGMGLRIVGLGGLAGAFAMSWDSDSSGAEPLALISLGLMATTLVWDIAAAPKSARIHNDKIKKAQLSVGMVPVDGKPALGLRTQLTF